MDKLRYKLYFPFSSYDESVLKAMSLEVKDNDTLPSLAGEINELVNSLYPTDAVTGNRSSDITRLLTPGITAMEKDRILASLQKMPTSKRNNLSDEDLINMLPSRYNSTLVDLDKVRDFYEEHIFSELDSKDNNSSSDNSFNVVSDSSNVE